jgi:hypothetical protein
VLRRATPERLSTFSDGVFAVLITVLVLELRPPERPTFDALLALWPTGLSYAVSYLFIAIVWANHHYLMRYADEATPRLLWFNFAHLFSMSLLPLSTAWMAISELAPQPVAFYRSYARRKDSAEGAQDHARALDDDVVLLRGGCGRGAEVPARWTRHLHLLSGRIPEAGTTLERWQGRRCPQDVRPRRTHQRAADPPPPSICRPISAIAF